MSMEFCPWVLLHEIPRTYFSIYALCTEANPRGNNIIAHSNHSFSAIATHGHSYWIGRMAYSPSYSLLALASSLLSAMLACASYRLIV